MGSHSPNRPGPCGGYGPGHCDIAARTSPAPEGIARTPKPCSSPSHRKVCPALGTSRALTACVVSLFMIHSPCAPDLLTLSQRRRKHSVSSLKAFWGGDTDESDIGRSQSH